MRAAALLACLAPFVPIALFIPQVGVLLWCWVAFMNPHQMAYMAIPLNMIVAVITLAGWLISREPKRIPVTPMLLLVVAMAVWLTVASANSMSPELSWAAWDGDIKMLILVIVVLGLIRTRARIHALVWVIVVSLGYFGVKGGLFVLITGGAHGDEGGVMGPPHTIIHDNNQLALALSMIIPLLNYLRRHSRAAWLRIGLAGAIVLTIVAVLGTYSRGGLIGLSILSVFFWCRSRHRLRTALFGLAVVVPAVFFLPDEWSDRMQSMGAYEQDVSAQDRLDAWNLVMRLVADRPLTGGGPESIRDRKLWDRYNPGKTPYVAHSIYFQVLGDMGYVGLFLYLLLIANAWRNAAHVVRTTRERPDLLWAHDLGLMIQVSTVGFLVSGALLSMAYYDVFFTLMAILTVLRELVGSHETAPTLDPAIGVIRAAKAG